MLKTNTPASVGNGVFLGYALTVIAASVLLGVGEQKLTELVQKLLFKKKEAKAAKA
jgi:hypothetical protein